MVRKEDIKYLPTKDEFYEEMDKVMGELNDSREEQTVQAHRLSDHEDSIENIEDNLQIKASN